MTRPAKTRAGMLLYRQLPEEYRYRDNRTEEEMGDLEAYLDGFGNLLDLLRETLEQSYADAFAEPSDNDRAIQPWLVPYLGELLQAELLAPDPTNRMNELNATVGWYKTKGTLDAIDNIADVVSGVPVMVIEGWKRTLVTPRLTLPPFTISPTIAGGKRTEADGTEVQDPPRPNPAVAAHRMPLGAPDMREAGRALSVDTGDITDSFVLPDDGGVTSEDQRRVHWELSSRRGAPCFPGHYDDRAVRTPDIGDISRRLPGPHPRRVQLLVQPPLGFFRAGQTPHTLAGLDPLGIADHVATNGNAPTTIGPRRVLGLADDATAPDKLRIEGDLTIPAGAVVELRDLLFMGRVSVEQGAHLALIGCVVSKLTLDKQPLDDDAPVPPVPMLTARDSIIGGLFAPESFARLEYVTVMGAATVLRLHASDCTFAGPLVDYQCAAKHSCIRYSAIPADVASKCPGAKALANTTVRPRFVRLTFNDTDGCHVRAANFGEPGYGVLDWMVDSRIAEGAEDRGELGAYHHRSHAARLRAVRAKLERFLPVGQTIAIAYDERLLLRPPRLAPPPN